MFSRQKFGHTYKGFSLFLIFSEQQRCSVMYKFSVSKLSSPLDAPKDLHMVLVLFQAFPWRAMGSDQLGQRGRWLKYSDKNSDTFFTAKGKSKILHWCGRTTWKKHGWHVRVDCPKWNRILPVQPVQPVQSVQGYSVKFCFLAQKWSSFRFCPKTLVQWFCITNWTVIHSTLIQYLLSLSV